MPKYTPSDEEMDSSMYGAEPAAPGAGAKPLEKPKPETPSIDEENAAKSEILIAKDQLPAGSKEGDTVTFKVVKDFGDEFSLQPVKESGEETETEETPSVEETELAALDAGEME